MVEESGDLEAEADKPMQLKEWFNEDRYRSIAKSTALICPKFDRQRFLDATLAGLAERSLMERLKATTGAMSEALPGNFRSKVAVLKKLAPEIRHGFIAIFLCDFVARFGLEDFDHSMESLRDLTRYGSAEFAVRPFLVEDQSRALKWMKQWSRDADEHVRRLASEGSRPRLPWGQRLEALVKDPTPVESILHALRADPSLYVRKSVANHLNDITKDHPEWVMQHLGKWDLKNEHSVWIAKRALRTLIKKGHRGALGLFGFGEVSEVTVGLKIGKRKLVLGEALELEVVVESLGDRAGGKQTLAVDYVIHYVKSDGGTRPKVFKGWELELGGGEKLMLRKKQMIRDYTTRKHYGGRHGVEIQVNGRKMCSGTFDLALDT